MPASGELVMRGRVVLVAGAGGGLGAAATLALARAGARLILLGRSLSKLNRLYDAVVAAGSQALLYPLDLEGASPDDFAELATRIGDEYGGLDGLLHCAAHFRQLTPLELTDPGEFARSVHINLSARWWLTQHCLPLLRKTGDAAAVFVLDTAASGAAYWGGYGLAQAGLAALVPMLQAELGESSVRVSGLMPGPLRTGLRARAFADDAAAQVPSRAADACVTLLSPAGADWRGKVWVLAPQGAV